MRAFRPAVRSALSSVLGSLILMAGLALATTGAHAAVHVYLNVGPAGYPVYEADYAAPGPGYNWTPAYYEYGQYYPGRWVAAREYREHRDWYGDRDRDWDHDRHGHRDWNRDRHEHRDWDRDRHEHRDRDDRHHDDD